MFKRFHNGGTRARYSFRYRLRPGVGCVVAGLSAGVWWRIFFLRDFSALQIEQRIHGGLTVPQDAAQFPSSPISGTENLSERNGLTGEFSADGPAQELVLRGRRGSRPCPSDQSAG